MRAARVGLLVTSGILVAGVLALLRGGSVPLGVRGEWEWLRVPAVPVAVDLVLSALACLGFAGFAALGMRSLGRSHGPIREAAWLAGLAAAAVGVQVAAHYGAPVGYGLEKWVVALSQKGSNGYLQVAKSEVNDLGRFLADYPDWIKAQDALHIGTHPPGLIVLQWTLLRSLGESPGASAALVENAPGPVTQAFRYFDTRTPMPIAERAVLVATGALTLVACALTVVPLYFLGRATLPAPAAWAAAALWPLVPSAILFQPTADAAFPLLSTSAFALAAWATRRGGRAGLALAAVGGVLLGIGMQLSLAFLAIGFVVALILGADGARTPRERAALILATGVGFLAVTGWVWWATGASPFAIWWVNQRNHARFYVEYPRTYLLWLVENPIELAVGLGLPAVVWGAAGLSSWREAPRAGVAVLATLVLLTVSGKNLSEVARLWLPFLPALLLFAGAGLRRFSADGKTLAATLALQATQTLTLQAIVQVVYPV